MYVINCFYYTHSANTTSGILRPSSISPPITTISFQSTTAPASQPFKLPIHQQLFALFWMSLPRFLYGVVISSWHPRPPRSPSPQSPGCLLCNWHASVFVFVSSLRILIFPLSTVTTREAQPSSRHFKGGYSSSVVLVRYFKGGQPSISGGCYTWFSCLFIWCSSRTPPLTTVAPTPTASMLCLWLWGALVILVVH